MGPDSPREPALSYPKCTNKREKMKIYIISYCQNEYQRGRVANFVHSQSGDIVNPSFSERDKNRYLTPTDCNKQLIGQAEQVWVILENDSLLDKRGIIQREDLAKSLEKQIRYFKINQTGRYVGRAHETEIEEFCGFRRFK